MFLQKTFYQPTPKLIRTQFKKAESLYIFVNNINTSEYVSYNTVVLIEQERNKIERPENEHVAWCDDGVTLLPLLNFKQVLRRWPCWDVNTVYLTADKTAAGT